MSVLIKGGRIVTAADDYIADILVEGETITLIGDSGLVAVAESYLRQLDLRQRQVALSVKILDVSLDNNTDIANSFAFRSGNSFIVSENGTLSATFGELTVRGDANPGLSYPNKIGRAHV